MGTQYTNDGGLGDFIVGQATGAGYNFYSSLGAQYHQRYTAPPAYRTGRRKRSAAAKPPRLIPDGKAERARWIANRRAVERKAPLFKWLSGHVVSYLDREGGLISDANGDLVAGEIVPRAEHLARLETAYRNFWQRVLTRFEPTRASDETAAGLCKDAEERLALLTRHRFVAPVNRTGSQVRMAVFRRRKTLLGTKLVRNTLWTVRVGEYDHRLRRFVSNVFRGGPRAWLVCGKDQLVCLDGSTVIRFFLHSPSRDGWD